MPDQSQEEHAARTPIPYVRYARFLLLIALIVAAIYYAVPPSKVVIETGPVGGGYHTTALRYKQVLERHGITVEIRPDPDSLDIIKHVDRSENGVQIGFIAQAINRDDYPETVSAGAVESQPLFGFYAQTLGEIETPFSLRGHTIVMPPRGSATSKATIAILKHYGITAENTTFHFMPIADAAKALHDKQADAGFFMLSAANPMIVSLANDDDLRFLPIPEAATLSRLEPFLTPIILPRRIYDIQNSVPPDDVPLLAARVEVVVRKDLHPAILYLLFDAMSEVGHEATLVSPAGVFPNLNNLSLPAHPLAKEYQKSGMPWIYRDLPLPIAGAIDNYLIVFVVIFIITEIYKSSKYLFELLNLLFETLSLRMLARIERRVRANRSISRLDRALVHLTDRALSRASSRSVGRELIGQIKESSGDRL